MVGAKLHSEDELRIFSFFQMRFFQREHVDPRKIRNPESLGQYNYSTIVQLTGNHQDFRDVLQDAQMLRM